MGRAFGAGHRPAYASHLMHFSAQDMLITSIGNIQGYLYA